MKRKYTDSILYLFVVCFLIGCNQPIKQDKPGKQQEVQPAKTKPGATGTDSLEVTVPSVVLFEPDPVQLQKIKTITEEGVFKSMVHESEFQFYTVRMYIKKNRPDLQVLSAKNARYIVFVRTGGDREIVDLDKMADAWGMYVFDPKKDPQWADMMNVDTEIPRYFSK